jgi:Methane oxygenase PmoA
MSITPAMSGLRRSVCLYRLVWTLALTLGGSAQAAPGAQILSVPAQDTVLQIAVKVPVGQHLDGEKRLAEIDVPGPIQLQAIPAEVIPGRQSDGARSPSEQMLVCTIPPRTGAEGLRRFRMFEVTGPAGKLAPAFRFEAVNEKSLGLWEGGRPVFVYNHGILSKQDVPADRNRGTYLHPIYGLDGEILTDDFPKDHYHHRGLFWAWPHVSIDGTNYDLWDIRGVYQRFERWLDRRSGPAAAILGVENSWYVGERKVVQERVWFTIYPASGDGQVIDLDFTWIPTDRPISLAGAEEKSYGGLTLRYAPRTQTVITTPLGNKPDDLAMTRLAWADLSAQFAGAPKPSGAAIFISPDHPDYPPTWLTRHYGALCVGWPGVTPATFQPGHRIQCRYRLWLHRGAPRQDELQRAYDAYRAAQSARWEAAPD